MFQVLQLLESIRIEPLIQINIATKTEFFKKILFDVDHF